MGGKLVVITNRKSYMSFRFVPKSVTLNNLERHNDRYFALFQRIRVPSGVLRKSSRSLSHLLMSSCHLRIHAVASEGICLISHCCPARLCCTGSSLWPCCARMRGAHEYSVVAKRLALRAFRTNTTRPHPLAAPRPASCWIFNNGLYFWSIVGMWSIGRKKCSRSLSHLLMSYCFYLAI